MQLQVSYDKEHYFLELLDDNLNPIKFSIAKGGPWLKYFRHSNSLCARALRVIVNHVPIGKYCLRFFPREKFKC